MKRAHNCPRHQIDTETASKVLLCTEPSWGVTPFLTFQLPSTECISLHPIYKTNEIVSFLIYHITSNKSKNALGCYLTWRGIIGTPAAGLV